MAPPRKSEAELARPRYRRGGSQEVTTRGIRRPADGFPPDPNWHPAVLRLYESVKDSGSETFYQQSDWAMLWMLCNDMSKLQNQQRPSAVMLQTIYNQLGNMLLTESDRRKVRIELHAPPAQKTDHRKAGQAAYGTVTKLDDKRVEHLDD